MRWRVGNGRDIRIWGQRWLPVPSSFSVQSPVRVLNSDAKVCELIGNGTRNWNHKLVREVFSKEEVSVICAIPLSRMGASDKIIWGLTKDDDWAEEGSPIHKWSSNGGDFEELWRKMDKELPQVDVERMVAIMQSIWSRRNTWIFENKFCSPTSVMKRALISLMDFQQVQNEGNSGEKKKNIAKEATTWQKLEEPYVKLNFDAAVEQREKRVGIGVVMRDFIGEVLLSLSAKIMHVASPFMAECKALDRALELCKELGLYSVWFEGDALQVMERVNREEEDES
ncbi:hypothetical protein CIPAW_15G166300 [Carya illinoinensis]|uniref:RNase H type-1 domain-containing protein n=1 Tax=Carya illinoinensis TaxID=32201 RepID=A0A8T1N8B2_CARIL|nr:hypothetical protein CIPAW_15G166300 [Carya illinoinensis]